LYKVRRTLRSPDRPLDPGQQPSPTFLLEIDTNLSLEQFRSWRTAARNLVDHKRRECRWWRQVAMQVWLAADGRVRGVASLDAVTTDESRHVARRIEPRPEERRDYEMEEAQPEVHLSPVPVSRW
jgi:hypothetical protein